MISRSGYEREGFARRYDRYRPRTPGALTKTLLQLARVEKAALVVDLGAGTGLSTRPWAELAERVVGIEPNEEMYAQATEQTQAANVEYVVAFSHDIGLPGGRADIVTCSQSLHWMEPGPTFAEAARMLRPGGVFAVYDYDVPPACDWEVEAAFAAFMQRRRAIRAARGIRAGSESWPKENHLERMRQSGCFRYCREFVVHSVEEGGVERIVGFARSLGLPSVDIAEDELERELRYDVLEDVARRVWGRREVLFLFGYRVRIGVV